MKTKDTYRGTRKTQLNQARSKPIQSTNLYELLVPLCTIIIVHNTARQRQFSLYSPSPDQHHRR